jgi:hypothetical protein
MAKPKLGARDWLFGAGGKRRLLEALLAERRRTWTEAELARAAGLHPKGSVDVHIAALMQIGVLARTGTNYGLVADHPLIRPLGRVLAVLSSLDDALLQRPSVVGDGYRKTQETR